jgi:ribonuclease HI
MQYTIFTDGSSRGNPGKGGYGSIIIVSKDNTPVYVREIGKGENMTTNNRMELSACIKAFENISDMEKKYPPTEKIKVFTDSSYVVNGITKWVKGWQKNNWQTKEKKDVLNKDLWESLYVNTKKYNVDWQVIGGHIGIKGNERCDEIATAMADDKDIELFDGVYDKYSIKDILDMKHDEQMLSNKGESRNRSNAKAYSYVSMVKNIIKVHETWADCEKRVKGVAGAKYKKALNQEEEVALIKSWRG